MTRNDNDKLTSWLLGLVFAGYSLEEAEVIVAEVIAEREALNAVGGG